MKPSRSPQRNTFQVDAYVKRCLAEGKEPSQDYLDLYAQADYHDQEWSEAEEHDNDMEWDLRTTPWILDKVRNSETYAQNLYAAMCNNEFQKLATFPILADQTCSYSWRYAGGIIADMRQEGDYIDWYCSGIRGEDAEPDGSVPESIVTDEIRADLLQLGWRVLDDEKDNF